MPHDERSRIPAFDENGNLPPGVHRVTLEDIRERLAWNPRRTALFEGLSGALANLKEAGCRRVWVNGSYVTSKAEPNDVDGRWDFAGVDPAKLDPVFLDRAPPRARMKAKPERHDQE
jgi:hypothetical protein